MIELTGTVIRGQGFEQKAPTANLELEHQIPPGIYTALVRRQREVIDMVSDRAKVETTDLGQAMIWAQPESNIVEVYIGEFSGDLYGEQLSLLQIHRIERPLICKLLDQALHTIPLNQGGPVSAAPTPETESAPDPRVRSTVA